MSQPKIQITDSQGRRHMPLEKDTFTIGRRPENDLQIGDRDVSREHAEIVREEETWVLRDLGSRFGTYVNGQKIEAARKLRHGDRIRVGPTGRVELTFLDGGTEPASTSGATRSTSSTVPIDLGVITTLLEGFRALATAKVLDDVLAIVLDAAIEITGAERGFVMLAGEEGGLEFKLGRARGKVSLPGTDFRTSRRVPERAYATGKTQALDLVEGGLNEQHRHTMELGIRGALCAPLKVLRFGDTNGGDDERRTIGVLYVDSRGRGLLSSATIREALENLATEAAVAIENARLYRESVEKARIDQELRIAAQIQQSLLPSGRTERGGFEIVGSTLPCRAIGGDFFDYFELPDGSYAFTLGDVSGKGPPAALLAGVLLGIFSSESERQDSAANTITRVNRALLRRRIENRFATLFYGVLQNDGRLTTCNAGHNPPYLLRHDGTIRTLDAGGLMVGMFEEAEFEEETVQLAPGDSLVVFSDGVTEAEAPDGDQFGEERLIELLERSRDRDAEGLLEAVQDGVQEFAADRAQADDVTVIVLRYRGA